MAPLSILTVPIDGIPAWKFVLRAMWVAVQLTLVLYVGRQGALFFYQNF